MDVRIWKEQLILEGQNYTPYPFQTDFRDFFFLFQFAPARYTSKCKFNDPRISKSVVEMDHFSLKAYLNEGASPSTHDAHHHATI